MPVSWRGPRVEAAASDDDRDMGDFIPGNDAEYMGEIVSVGDFSVFVEFDGNRSGAVHFLKIPGCERNGGLPELCQVGDRIKVSVEKIHRRHGHIYLDCVEFPVD